MPLPPRYEYRRPLGEGGMGEVHLVHDAARGEDVALKALIAADDPAATFMFQQEYWSMTSLRHPNLVAAFDYGVLPGGRPYFTMEFVPGEDLAATRRPEAEVRAWLPDVAAALAHLHGQGYVHGDLKPENVRIREDGTPKLMDLGLLTRVGRSAGAIRGSVLYMAPEAIRQSALDGRADLYALGAVVYHLLAGRPPFQRENTLALLRAHLEAAPTPLSELVPDIDPALATGVMALLAKDPARRPPHAAAALAALGLPAAFAGGGGLLGSPILGREEVLERLSEHLTAPAGSVLRLVGPAGAGKTRLLDELRARAQVSGLATMYVAGRGPDASPYEAVRPVLRALLGPASEERDRLAPVLVRLAPELGVEPAPALEGANERARLHDAVAELARARAADTLWIIDDVDALDGASRELLATLRRQGEGLAWRWLTAAADPADDEPACLLAPLADEEALAITRATLGQDDLPGEVAERLPTLAAGLPGAIEAVLAHWVHVGALRHAAGRWTAGDAASFDLPGGAAGMLDQRFAALGDDARHLGHVAAVLGRTSALPLLAAVAGQDDASFFPALAALVGAELITCDDQAYRFERPVQATVLSGAVAPEQRRAWHAAAAQWLAGQLPGGPDDPAAPLGEVLAVARHHLAGEPALSAVPWVLAGARRALALFALDAAVPLVEAALALDGLADEDRLALLVLQANLLRPRGQSADALALFEREDLLGRLAAAGSPDLVRETVTFGVLLMAAGRLGEAMAAWDRAIAQAGGAQDAAEAVRAHRFAGRVAYFEGRRDEARSHLQQAADRARGSGLAAPLASTLGFFGYLLATGDASQTEAGLAMLAEAVSLNRALGNVIDLTDTLISQGSVYMALGRFAEAREAFEGALASAVRLGITVTAMTARLNLAAVALELGDLAIARAHARVVAEYGEQLDRRFELAYALALGGLAATLQGDLVEGPARLDRALEVATTMGQRAVELDVRVARAEALLVLGRGAEAAAEVASARAHAAVTGSAEHASKLDRLDAIAALHAAVAGPDALLPAPPTLLSVPTPAAADDLASRFDALVAAARGRHPASLAHALRWAAAAAFWRGRPAEALAAVGEARDLARAGGLELLGAELDLLDGMARAATDAEGARKALAAALAAARALGIPALIHGAEAALAELGGDRRGRHAAAAAMWSRVKALEGAAREAYLSWPERRLLAGGHVPAEPEAVAADRLREVLEMAGELDLLSGTGNVVNAALTSMLALTGAERGFLLLYEDAEVCYRAFMGMNPDDPDEFSTTLADRVYWSNQAVFIEDALADPGLAQAKSVLALSLRSVFGVPLRARGEVLGVLIADSRQINPDFTAAHLELAQALGDHVARAIEGARELERADARIDRLERLVRLGRATAGVADLESFMAIVAAEALALTGAQQAFLVTGPDLACVAAFGADGAPLPAAEQRPSSSVCRWVLEHGERLHLADAQQAEGFQQQKSVLALALRMVYAVPVEADGERLGVLYLHDQRLGPEVDGALEELAAIGELVGAFLRNRSPNP